MEDYKIEANRSILDEAIAYTKSRQYPTILVSPSRDRIIRGKAFDGHDNKFETPTIAEFLQLREKSDGVLIATICDPNKQAKWQQIKRGQKGNKGGRPSKSNSHFETQDFTQEQLRASVWETFKTLPLKQVG